MITASIIFISLLFFVLVMCIYAISVILLYKPTPTARVVEKANVIAIVISDLKILRSGNGYYIGRTARPFLETHEAPYKRESVEFFESYADAWKALEQNKYTKRSA